MHYIFIIQENLQVYIFQLYKNDSLSNKPVQHSLTFLLVNKSQNFYSVIL